MSLVRTALWHRARKVIPGGVNSPVRAMRGVGLDEPFFVTRGEGAYLETADGRRLLDWVQSWGPLHLRARRSRDDRGGARGRGGRHDVRRRHRARGRAGRGDRRRLPVDRARAARLVGHRGGDVGDPAGAGVHAPRPRDQVRRLLPRPRRPVPRERRLGPRDARHPLVARRPVGRHRRHDRRAVQRRRRPSPRQSRCTARGSPRSSSSRSPGTWAASRPRPASSRRCARSATRRVRCSSSTR